MEVSTWTDIWTLYCLHLEMELVFGVCSFDLADFLSNENTFKRVCLQSPQQLRAPA